MTKTLYIHIGHYKTGTTAIQQVMAENRRLFVQQGVDYCLSLQQYNKHSDLAFSLLHAAGTQSLMHGYARAISPEEMWEKFASDLKRSKHDKLVISSEEFARIGAFPRASERLQGILKSLGQEINVRVIAYLRPPQEHLRSWFNQLVKMGIRTPDYNQAVARFIEPVHYDFDRMLRPWIQACGAKSVYVRRYPGQAENGWALHRDFLGLIGLSHLSVDQLKLPSSDPNPRRNVTTMELVRVLQNYGVPSDFIEQSESRAQKYLKTQQDMVPPLKRVFWDSRTQSDAGLSVLKELPHCNIKYSEFSTSLPEREPDRLAELALLQGFLLDELRAVHERIDEMETRLSGLERRQVGKRLKF